jgi:hypothetical protein
MRDVQRIWDAWESGGPYIGDTKPQSRVTVELGWSLQTTGAVLGTWNRGPARWYVDENHDMTTEVELPNVVSVNLSRGVDADAGSCDIVIRNVMPPGLGDPEIPLGQFGNIGAYTWDHGSSQDAKARWGHVANQWHDVLVPNALLRTYQGFGGEEKPLPQAVADGHLVLNGVWLVDDITVGTDGTMSIKCRDMAKLLLDQQLFPPLVPYSLYPLLYKRWDYREFTIPPEPDPGDTCYYTCSYGWSGAGMTTPWHSSTDETYGEYNTGATGHLPAEAFDISYEPADATQAVTPGYFSHQRSYWLSEPKGGPNDWVWLEFTIDQDTAHLIDSIYYHPWGALDYVQVSVFENGEWQTAETAAGGYTVHGMPFVGTFVAAGVGVPGEDTNTRPLPRIYNATRIRLTITNMQAAAEGGFRIGARKIMTCYHPPPFAGLLFAGGSIPVNDDNPQREGYWEVRSGGKVYAFGDARTYPANSPQSEPSPGGVIVSMAVHPSGQGYWLLDSNGRVTSHGLALYWGDAEQSTLNGRRRTDLISIAPLRGGEGYWILAKNGDVFAFGYANSFGNSYHDATMPSGAPATARSIESHPTQDGYWVLWSDGFVAAHGLPDLGSAMDRTGFTLAEYCTRIRRNSTGTGYWVLSGGGHVQALPAAEFFGNVDEAFYDPAQWFRALTWDILPSSINDKGYAIMRADGNLTAQGDSKPFGYGSVGSGGGIQRFDGNYKDYVDIIRELLLWSGFYLHKDPQPVAEMPEVYGNLESTGAYSDANLPPDMFDKRAVMDAIKQIRDIVGFQFWIDAEGGARFESPNWWTLGNYLIDGRPYDRVPEIDERVNLLSHSVVRSASQARSKLIIANNNPMPTAPGKPPAEGVLTTEIVPRTAPDLKGLVVPAMWVNQAFLKVEEQKIMAELLDLRTWFSRRTASVSCVANPLIDINDQVRVLERQTGEVYIHYIRNINISHDLTSGSFTMDLTTHWLGGSPYGINQFFLAGATRPQNDGHWLATIGGYERGVGAADSGVYAFGNADLYERHQADSHLDLIVSMRSTPTGNGYYTLDRRGKMLTYGDAVHRGDVARNTPDVIDMALTPSGQGYWIVERNGFVNVFGDAVSWGDALVSGTMANGQPVRVEAIEAHPTADGYWILLSDGGVQAFNVEHHGNPDPGLLAAPDYFTNLRTTEDGDGYWVLSSNAVVQGRGSAVELGNGTALADEGPAGITWELLTDANGYAIVHGSGRTETFNFADRTPVAGPSDGWLVWSIVSEEAEASLARSDAAFTLSIETIKFLKDSGSQSATNAVAGGFGIPEEPQIKAIPS